MKEYDNTPPRSLLRSLDVILVAKSACVPRKIITVATCHDSQMHEISHDSSKKKKDRAALCKDTFKYSTKQSFACSRIYCPTCGTSFACMERTRSDRPADIRRLKGERGGEGKQAKLLGSKRDAARASVSFQIKKDRPILFRALPADLEAKKGTRRTHSFPLHFFDCATVKRDPS